MGSVPVVVLDELVEGRPQVTAATNQRPVETFLADRTHEPLREGIGSPCSHRRPDHLDAPSIEHVVEGLRELRIAVSDQDLNLGQIAGHREVAGLLDDPGTTRTARDTGEMHPAGPELDEEQRVQPA